MDRASLLTAAQTAEILGISTASVKNWQRHGYLTNSGDGFLHSEVLSLLSRIQSGEVQRLGSRANKKQAAGTIEPASEFRDICEAVSQIRLGIPELMFLVAVRQLMIHGQIENAPLELLLSFKAEYFNSKALLNHLKTGFTAIETSDSPAFAEAAEKLLRLEIPEIKPSETDLSGIIYQAIRLRGERSVSGSFYTPPIISDSMIRSAQKNLSDSCLFIDPCCGTGQFLLSFIAAGGSPANAYGLDSDTVAAFTAASNIFLECPDINFQPKIFTCDSLMELPGDLPASFNLTATNPPWGACNSGRRAALERKYPAIRSGESFSYFIARAFELTKPGGYISIVLPESITNVKRHKDVRELIIKNGLVTEIKEQGRMFKGVYTPVITMEIKKERQPESNLPDIAFNININSTDSKIIDKIYSVPHTTLEESADWALGIVTGDNKRYLIDHPAPGFEPILRGSDIGPGTIGDPSHFIKFTPDRFQQTAPEWKYRAPEKLIYRFISRRLVFAVDKQQYLTLNSANVLLPGACGYCAETLMRLFNSEVYNFLFMKRFNSVKVLRGHLEQLPLPDVLSADESPELSRLFRLSEAEENYIKIFVNTGY